MTTQNAQQPIGWLHMEESRITCFTKNPTEPTLKNEKKVPVYLHPTAPQQPQETEEVAALKKQIDALKSAIHQTQQIGRYCLSEDDCITHGIDFAAYERGIIHAIGAMQNHVMTAMASAKGGAE